MGEKAELPGDAELLYQAVSDESPVFARDVIAKIIFCKSTVHVQRLCRHYLIKYGRSFDEHLQMRMPVPLHNSNASSPRSPSSPNSMVGAENKEEGHDKHFIEACRRILPTEDYVWGVLPRTHSRVLERLDAGDVDAVVKQLLSLHGGRRLHEVLILAEKRLGVPLAVWAEQQVAS